MRQLAIQSRSQDSAHQPNHDDVTGLATRRHAEHQLAALLDRAAAQGTKVAILHIDIDRLKEINHSLGRPMGDACLRLVAQRVSEVIDFKGSVSRLDSDEVMATLPDVTGLEAVVTVVERLLERTRQPIELSGRTLFASCCIGLALYPDHGDTVAELMRHANLARRKAQAGGSRRHCVFSPELLDEGPDRMTLRCELRDALARGEMALRYRPVLCARSGQVVAVSAQPRWCSPRFGVLEAARWWPAARDNDQVHDICSWVLARACRHARSWYEAGSGLRVVVGMPAEGVAGDQLAERVREVLAESGLPAGLLEIELNEGGLMQDPEHACATLERLQACGVRLSLDGFGKGHSLLGHLGLLPIDTLKLDALFLVGCLDNPRRQAVIRSVIRMAHELGVRVAASGVESRLQADFLREQGCDLLQGSLWSRMEYSDPSPE
ncbi:EAL domain-containing protein [Halomonas sp. MCCC 1A17488]|uniref:putative bifunctional diguanylate cyclase/phosphodiesterase n=1 Tax=unclassified Halomonas TaxID=2609666 RepID=UPI0018D22D51|nr:MULTISPECIES: EAL domain-containing protein [unclassified Halomonas]MCE8016589.1 EAL domain-containing protein [Halomonas sp. MCCC 1A17488]MCG3239922.1 EAL domain-containing protein [Halomonas sp. MCCC 1A17488]QPP50185.1 EAL domain-containing protein [Halomonas sp. SS10-MC5]